MQNKYLRILGYIPSGRRPSGPPNPPTSLPPGGGGLWAWVRRHATALTLLVVLLANFRAVAGVLDYFAEKVHQIIHDIYNGLPNPADPTKPQSPPVTTATPGTVPSLGAPTPMTPSTPQSQSPPASSAPAHQPTPSNYSLPAVQVPPTRETLGRDASTPKKVTRRPSSGKSPHPITSARSSLADSVAFKLAATQHELELLLHLHPESKEVLAILSRNHWIFGSRGAAESHYVPLAKDGSFSEFRRLAATDPTLNLVEIHIPAEWSRDQLENHLDRWVSNASGVTRERIAAWNTLDDSQGHKVNICAPGGVCLLLTPRWNSRAFSDFRAWEPAGEDQ